jgi:hypothetical protein
MQYNSDVQKVDIDTYFSDLDDHAIHNRPNPSEVLDTPLGLALKQLLITPATDSAPVLKPYVRDQAPPTGDRKLSPNELESAHGAVRKLREQISATSSPDTPPLTEAEPASHSLPSAPKQRYLLRGLRVAAAVSATAIAVDTAWSYGNRCLAVQCYVPLATQVSAWHLKAQDMTRLVLAFQTPTPDQASTYQKHLNEGMQYGYTAARMTQRASTTEDWQQVIHLWQLALHSLNQIPSDDAAYHRAQAKVVEYQQNLNYSRLERTQSAFRRGVKMAEEASQLTGAATSEEDWEQAAQRWQLALSLMQSVPHTSDHFPIAQAKLIEYSTKYAYTQQRYLYSQGF